MNIELKSIQVYEKMSEETSAFTASIYIDGKKVGYTKNDGRGGATVYHADHHDYWPLIKEADEFCKKMPPFVYDVGRYGITEGGKPAQPIEVPADLESYIDDIVLKHIQERDRLRFEKNLKKHQLNSLCIGNEDSYNRITWPKKNSSYTIEELLKSEQGRKSIKDTIKKYKAKMLPNERLLNTNIPAYLL